MPFPDQALDVAVELLLGGEWVDITPHVYTRDPITITRGRADEASRADPASCTLTINNRDGRYSPRNPMSPYYGLLGRNTPIRISVTPDPAGPSFVRFYGEVPAWPVKWLPGGTDVWVPIEAAGITRRLGQGAKPLQSALYRAISGKTPYAAWWPLEDSRDAVQGAPGYPGGPAMRPSGGASFTGEPVDGTAGGMTFQPGGKASSTVSGGGSNWAIAFWVDVPAVLDPETHSPVVEWSTPASPWAVQWYAFTNGVSGGVLNLFMTLSSGLNGLTEFGTIDLRGRGLTQILVTAQQVGTQYTVRAYVDGVLDLTVPIPDDTATPITAVALNASIPEDYPLEGIVAHIIVSGLARQTDLLSHVSAGSGYTGETAATRILRLCGEEGVPIALSGAAADTEAMGPQQPKTFLELLGECEAADGGSLAEQVGALGLTYRTRAADYNTPPALVLDYHDQVAAPLEPVDDDQRTRNDVTIEREGGSSARAVVESGPLSVLPPPDGVGIYNESLTLNVAADEQLLPIASWRAHLGTVDEARFPVVRVKLHKHPELITAVTGADLRSRIHLVAPPLWVTPGLVDLIVDGYTEVIEPLRWTVEYNTVPGTPYRVASLDDEVLGRLDTDGSQLAAAVDADDTVLSVAVTAGPLWTIDPAEFPFDVVLGGEVVTVTGITGGSSPQIFTVVRAANGITKPHAAGTALRLAQPMILAL